VRDQSFWTVHVDGWIGPLDEVPRPEELEYVMRVGTGFAANSSSRAGAEGMLSAIVSCATRG
jgi:hypothetical protein